jgi:hypothetical protein
VNTQLSNHNQNNRNFAARYPQFFRAVSAPLLAGAALLTLMPLSARATDEATCSNFATNSFSFSARMGFNISARFKNPGRIAFASNRTTPDGAKYNYDDGYVLTDVSGNELGYTSNWGYDSTASQYSGGNILMSKTTSASQMATPWMDMDPSVGGELLYRRAFGEIKKWHCAHYGLELAGNFMTASANDHRAYTGSVARQTDAYVFPGVQPPEATPDDPFTGTFTGPNAVLTSTPSGSTFSSAPGSISGNRKVDADIFGFRVGPYIEFPLGTNFNLSLSGGFAGAVLDVNANWNETLTVGTTQYPFSGSGHDSGWRMGGYIAATAEYEFVKDWSLTGGVQFQSLGNYERTISGRDLEIKLSSSLFVTLGLGYKF